MNDQNPQINVPQRRARPEYSLALLLLVALTLLLALQFFKSLEWRMVHDTPLLQYMAFLIDRFGYVPYVDIFTTDFPGALAFHLGIGKLLGYGDIGFRLVDAFWLIALSLTTWAIMRRFNSWVAWASVVLFALSYLQYGPSMSLQRDYVAILPIALAVWLSIGRRLLLLRVLVIGFLFGLAMTIKPQLGVGVALVLLYILLEEYRGRSRKRKVLGVFGLGIAAVLGMAIPLGAAYYWIDEMGAWPAFVDMVLNYMPLHLDMTGDHKIIGGIDRLLYLMRSFGQLGGLTVWLAPATLGVYLAAFHADTSPKQRHVVWLLFGLALAYGVLPVLSGQFWQYHWMPFQYFVVILSGLTLVALPGRDSRIQRLYPILILAVVAFMFFTPRNEFIRQMVGRPPDPPKDGRVDAIAAFLNGQLGPDDTVQPLDWTGGAVQGMLVAEARLATPYIYDYYFYHHVSDPYIQNLRADFMADLSAARPRFIVEVLDSPRPSGPGTSTEFPELRTFMAENYYVNYEGDGFVIYRRRP